MFLRHLVAQWLLSSLFRSHSPRDTCHHAAPDVIQFCRKHKPKIHLYIGIHLLWNRLIFAAAVVVVVVALSPHRFDACCVWFVFVFTPFLISSDVGFSVRCGYI